MSDGSMNVDKEDVFKLLVNSSERHLTAKQFLNFFNEILNERLEPLPSNGDESENKHQEQSVYTRIADELFRGLETQKSVLIADYVVEVVFVNYNRQLLEELFSRLSNVTNGRLIIHLFNKASAFLHQLSDRLVIEQVSQDMADVILPSLLSRDFDGIDPLFVKPIAKFLMRCLALANKPLKLSSPLVLEHVHSLMSRLSRTDKLLHKKLLGSVTQKLNYHDQGSGIPSVLVNGAATSPATTSPNFAVSPSNYNYKEEGARKSGKSYQAIRMSRYYKNLWLNSKIISWSAGGSDFALKYSSIDSILNSSEMSNNFNSEAVFSDLIETTFTCFAQFVSNKQYHEPNSNYNLLERQWVIFITKQLPLLIMENASQYPGLIQKSIEAVDDKVAKALRSYGSEKENFKERNEDLFDDFPNNSLDIRHDFIKNLIMLKLQPPSLLNDFLREDQVVDIKSLSCDDSVKLKNEQGVREVIDDFSAFITTALRSMDIEGIFETSGTSTIATGDRLIQTFQDFESVAPTKQREAAQTIFQLLCDAVKDFDYRLVAKICCVLTMNWGHSLTSILSFVAPSKFAVPLCEFLEDAWDMRSERVSESLMEDSDLELNSDFVIFTHALLFLITLQETYGIKLTDIFLSSKRLSTQNSFILDFVSHLGQIPDRLELSNGAQENKNLLETWFRDLFINGSISDSLMKSTGVKDLAHLVPFIFKQSVESVEVGALRDVSPLIGGFEYFLQPFMIIGMIGIVFWLEPYLCTVKSKGSSDEFFESLLEMLNSLINPATLNDESRPLHTIILRLNAPKLLKALRAFRSQTQPNYGIYSADAQGHPKLESLISHLEDSLKTGIVYNVDPRLLSNSNGYSQKDVIYAPFIITNETTISSILTNQINSFWNLHSSTYFNLDYLMTLVSIITPGRFLEEVLESLKEKTLATSTQNSKIETHVIESQNCLDLLFYFLVFHDMCLFSNKVYLLQYMESTEDTLSLSLKQSEELKYEPDMKVEQQADEDFDMLFGEDTSTAGNDPELLNQERLERDMMERRVPILLRSSFARILHEKKLATDELRHDTNYKDSLASDVDEYHSRYVRLLDTVVI
ncbi:LAMI_0E03136g1_1 [Lachancea mirantina]|uniref:Mediator of RNA polymerase II transcription subunit 5 n=1 Tax=Lachancea mirantina TaxID=1230905 RepID=A0A1G4JK27_9SACH|nr:LAMI_0E03136g1_1 [Lachancea mirantina]